MSPAPRTGWREGVYEDFLHVKKKKKEIFLRGCRLFCEEVMLVKEGAGRKRGKNSHPCRVTRRRGMAVRRPRVTSPRSQRAATRRGDGTRGNASPPLAPNSIVEELLELARTRGRGKGVQLKTIHKTFLEHSCHTHRMVIVEF